MLRWTGGSRNRVKAAGGGGRGGDFGPSASRPHALIQCRQHRCPPPSFLTQDNNNNGSLASLEHQRNSSGGETRKRTRSDEGDDATTSVDIAGMMGGVCRAAHPDTATDWTSRQAARRGSSLPQITCSSLMSSSHDIDALMWATRSTTLPLTSGQVMRPSAPVVVAGAISSAAAGAVGAVSHVQPRSIVVRSAEVKVPSISPQPPPPHQLLPSSSEYRDAASSSIFFEEGSSDDDAQTDAIAETFTSAQQHSSQLLQQQLQFLPSSSSSFDRQLFPAPSLWAATPAAAPLICFHDPSKLQPTADNHNNWSYPSDDWSYVTASPLPPPLLDYYCPPDHTQHHPCTMTSSWSGGWEADRAPPPLPSAFAVSSHNHHQRYCRDSDCGGGGDFVMTPSSIDWPLAVGAHRRPLDTTNFTNFITTAVTAPPFAWDSWLLPP